MCKPEHASDVFYLRAGTRLMSTRPNSSIYDEWLSLQEDEWLNSLNNMSEGCLSAAFYAITQFYGRLLPNTLYQINSATNVKLR